MNIPTFKIRASAAHEILGGAVGLTEKQEARYNELMERRNSKTAKPLTANMLDELAVLAHKIVNPQLPEGAKTYCEKWLKEQLYDRRKNFANKYLEKGIACEDESIQFAAENLGWGNVSKNDERFEDEYFEGTPDIITELTTYSGGNGVTQLGLLPVVIDMKNVWDCFTMPLFEEEIPTKGYETQLQVYMHLVSKEYDGYFDTAILCYALMDAPLNVMEKEMRYLSWEQGQQGLITDEIRQKVHREMTYSDLPAELRLKTYEVKRDKSVIDELIFRVDLCREYIEGLLIARGHETVAC